MRTSRKSLGFFGIIVRNFIIFSVVVLVVLIIALIVGLIIVFYDFTNDYFLAVNDYKDYFIEGDYEYFDRERVLGQGGYFAVFDENNNIIYRSEEAETFNLSEEQIKLIPKIDTGITISKTEYVGLDDNKYTIVSYETMDDDSDTIIISNIIADDNFNIVFTDMPNIKKQFSEFDFNLLTGKYKEIYEISKLSYTGIDGQINNAVFCINIEDFNGFFSSPRIIKYIVYAYIIFFIFAVLLFFKSLYKKAKEPLDILNDAIESFAEGKTNKLIEYKGPREFEEICHNFNDMATKLNEAEKKRVAAEQQKQKMLADISHDLKTPITVIKGYAKAITDKKVVDEELGEYLNTIYKKSNSLAELINTFSEYSKLERPDFKIKAVKTNICEFARNYFIEKYNELEFLGFELDIQIPDQGIFCMLDVFEMKRVFENIISNTVKYNEKGTIISFVLEKRKANCVIRIGDNGVGIPDELKKIIFNPFSVGDASRSEVKSSGLGMAIVKKIVDSHMGDIKLLHEQIDGFSVIYEITLPLIEEEK